MKTVLIVGAACVITFVACVAWDCSNKAQAADIIDQVYLRIGSLPDGTNRDILSSAEKKLTEIRASMLVIYKHPIERAAEEIGAQKNAAERCMDNLRMFTDGDIGRKISADLRSGYASGMPAFKERLAYVRRGF